MCNNKKTTIRTQGFTLVELSIVIIIIGFLIAGIAAGTSLIKQAEINSVVTDLQGFQTAYNNFQLRFNGVPGDIKNADAYWDDGVCAVTKANCNGDGNGVIAFATAVPDETASAWKELALSNMVSSGIVAIPDAWAGVEVIGSTVPTSKVTGAGYLMVGSGSTLDGTISSPWTDNVTNAAFIGKVSTAGLGGSALKPEDAFNMDKKVDDGTVSGSNFTGNSTGNFRSVTGASGTCITNGNYDLTQTAAGCVSGLALN